jgi:hypothetical protein
MSNQITDSRLIATITFAYDEAGRKADLLTGGNGREDQSRTGPIEHSDLNLFNVSDKGQISQSLLNLGIKPETHWQYPLNITGWGYHRFSTAQTWDSLLGYLRNVESIRAAIKAEYAEKRRVAAEEQAAKDAPHIEAFLADNQLLARDIYGSNLTLPDGYNLKETSPRFQEVRDEANRRMEARKAANQAEAKRRTQAKLEQIATFVAEHGTQNQKERFAADLLPEGEILGLMEAEAFKPFSGLPLYDVIEDEEVRATCSESCKCHDSYDSDDSCSIDYDSDDAETLTAEEWEAFKKIQAIKPEAKITLRRHVGKCKDRDCDPAEGEGIIRRNGFYVKLTIGAFTFNREFTA